MSERVRATIKRHNQEMGYGFLVLLDSSDRREHFYHRSSCQPEVFDRLKNGMLVWCEPCESTKRGKGPRALNILIGIGDDTV